MHQLASLHVLEDYFKFEFSSFPPSSRSLDWAIMGRPILGPQWASPFSWPDPISEVSLIHVRALMAESDSYVINSLVGRLRSTTAPRCQLQRPSMLLYLQVVLKYRNTIELHRGNDVVPLRSDTIRLVQNGCSFHGLRSKDPNQHLNDFLKLVDSLNLDFTNRERKRMRLFQFSLRDEILTPSL
ncbi:hypothetical protein Tco_1100305 [Tanacetum coccineum]